MSTLNIPLKFKRGAYRDHETTIESAVFLIRYTCDRLGVVDLTGWGVLDVGCGTKFTEAFLDRGLPVGSYVGVDVCAEMIDFLQENVRDLRFEYRHIDVRNERYNPDAPAMTEDTDLGLGDRRFDLICLFSVFTHLAPHDYRMMLRLLRRYVRPHGRLIYTLFIDELTDGGYGFVDSIDRTLASRVEPVSDVDLRVKQAARDVKPFVDLDPYRPLLRALYSREYARALIDGTGWTPLELLPPNEHAQHHFICAPARHSPPGADHMLSCPEADGATREP
jgi:SAM-dependent methyltransferase